MIFLPSSSFEIRAQNKQRCPINDAETFSNGTIEYFGKITARMERKEAPEFSVYIRQHFYTGIRAANSKIQEYDRKSKVFEAQDLPTLLDLLANFLLQFRFSGFPIV